MFLGMTEADVDAPPPLAVWPDNAAAVRVFIAMATQWEMAQGVGYTRLIYEALDRPMRMARVTPEDEDDVFAALQVMERQVLTLQREARKK